MSSTIVLGLVSAVTAAGILYGVYKAIDDEKKEEQPVANNTYSAGHGYYHSNAHSWFPWQYGYHDPSRGYFYDGAWVSNQLTGPHPPPSVPPVGQRFTAPSAVAASAHADSGRVSRGGFGGSGFFHGVCS